MPCRRHRPPRVIALLDAGEQFRRASVMPRRQQVQKFRVRPNERHGAARRLAGFEPACGYCRPVPDLFRNEAPRSGHSRHHLQVGQRIDAQQDIEIAALAGEQRPGAADAGAVEGAPILVLAVAVGVIAVIGDAVRRLDLEDAVGDLQRVLDARVPGVTQAQAGQVDVFHADQADGGTPSPTRLRTSTRPHSPPSAIAGAMRT